MLLATMEFVVAHVLLLTAIGVMSTSLELTWIRWFMIAWRPVILLQPMKIAVVLTPAFVLTLVLFIQDRRGIPVDLLIWVPPTLMKVFVPVVVHKRALGCRQAHGLIAVFGLTRVVRMRDPSMAVLVLMAVLTRAALGLTIVFVVIWAELDRRAPWCRIMLVLSCMLVLT